MQGSHTGRVEGITTAASLLLDSGSDEHVCRQEFVKSIKPYFDGYQEKLLDIQQNELITLGKKQVPMTFGPSDDVAGTVDFVVGEVHDDILSLGKLLRMGYTFDLSNRDGMYMRKGDQCVPLYLQRNSLRVQITPHATYEAAKASRVAPV